jgi:hypothetical protein
MALDLEKLHNWFESEEGEAFIGKERQRGMIKRDRYHRFEEWLSQNDFDTLIYRLIFEHDDEYREKCYSNGCEPYPNNKLSFIIEYVTDTFQPISVPELNSEFMNSIYPFKGYFIQIIHGQGTIAKIYNREDKRLLLQV